MKRFLKINSADNVAVVLVDGVKEGEWFEDGGVRVRLLEGVPRGHKFALRDIGAGEDVVKYGSPIGHSTAPIVAGEWVHSHNLETSLSDNPDYTYEPVKAEDETSVVSGNVPVVDGYLRRDGEMGIRNELWIIPTVGCVNGVADAIANRLRNECGNAPGVDDIRAFTHNYGCSQLGDDHANTRRALAAMAVHPNAGGVLIVGLGCENNQIDALREQMGEFDGSRVRFLVSQQVDDEIAEGVKLGKELAARMASDCREPLPVSKLKVGLKCGGSDGLSGITANPLVGLLSDRLLMWGATTVLTEVPEMFGAETILMKRARSREVFASEVKLINGFKDYFRKNGQPIYENPSPGNKAGGITTLEEKSLGCVQKGGSGMVVDVLGYAEQLKRRGLNLLNAPGNDLVASTALALSGCQIVLFTTGRGTPFGTFVPTMKIATNSALASRKKNWIDFNAGGIIEQESMAQALECLIAKLLATASGAPVCNELNGNKEIAIFKTGVTL